MTSMYLIPDHSPRIAHYSLPPYNISWLLAFECNFLWLSCVYRALQEMYIE